MKVGSLGFFDINWVMYIYLPPIMWGFCPFLFCPGPAGLSALFLLLFSEDGFDTVQSRQSVPGG